jgi:hypothetical protein
VRGFFVELISFALMNMAGLKPVDCPFILLRKQIKAGKD